MVWSTRVVDLPLFSTVPLRPTPAVEGQEQQLLPFVKVSHRLSLAAITSGNCTLSFDELENGVFLALLFLSHDRLAAAGDFKLLKIHSLR